MNLASIEKLVLERADQRTPEVLGLLLSYLEKQDSVGTPRAGYGYLQFNKLVLDGVPVMDVMSVAFSFNADLTVNLEYTTFLITKPVVRVFQNIKFESSDNIERYRFDDNNYFEVIKSNDY